MGLDHLSKKEAGEILDQMVHVLAYKQELRHSTSNFAKLAGDYLGDKSPIFLSMGTWLRQIDRFKWKYDKNFAKDPLFGRI